MKKSIVALRLVLIVATGALLLALSLGGCNSPSGTPDRSTPAPGAPGPHNGTANGVDSKDQPVRAPGPRN